MPRQPTRLSGPALLSNAASTKYTVPAGAYLVIRSIHIENPTASIVNFTMSIGADAAGTRVFDAYPIPANTDAASKGIWDYFPSWGVLAAGEIIQAFAGTNNVVTLTIEGDVFTA